MLDDNYKHQNGKCEVKEIETKEAASTQPVVNLVDINMAKKPETTLVKDKRVSNLIEEITNKLESRKEVGALVEEITSKLEIHKEANITNDARPSAGRKLNARNFDLGSAEKLDGSNDISLVSSNGTYINGKNIKGKGQIKLEEQIELGFGMCRSNGSYYPPDDIQEPYYVFKVLNLPDIIDICDSDSDEVVFVGTERNQSRDFKTSTTNLNNNESVEENAITANKTTPILCSESMITVEVITDKENGECSKNTSPVGVKHHDICDVNSKSFERKKCSFISEEDKIEQHNFKGKEAADNKPVNLNTICDNDSISKNCDISREERELRELLDCSENKVLENEGGNIQECKQTEEEESSNVQGKEVICKETKVEQIEAEKEWGKTKMKERNEETEEDTRREEKRSKETEKEQKHKIECKERENEQKHKKHATSKHNSSTSRSRSTSHDSHSSRTHKKRSHKDRNYDRTSKTDSEHHSSKNRSKTDRKNSTDEFEKNEATKENKDRKNEESSKEKQAVIRLQKCDEPTTTKIEEEIIHNNHRKSESIKKIQDNKIDKRKRTEKKDKTSGRAKNTNDEESSRSLKETESNNSKLVDSLLSEIMAIDTSRVKPLKSASDNVDSSKVLTKSKADHTFSGVNTLNVATKNAKVKDRKKIAGSKKGGMDKFNNYDEMQSKTKDKLSDQPFVKLVDCSKVIQMEINKLNAPNLMIATTSKIMLDDNYKHQNGKCEVKEIETKEAASRQPVVNLVGINMAKQPETTLVKDKGVSNLIEEITSKLESRKEVGALVEEITSKLEIRKEANITNDARPSAGRKLNARNFDLGSAEKLDGSNDISLVPAKRKKSEDSDETDIEKVPPPDEIDDVVVISDGEEFEFMRSQLYIKEEPIESDNLAAPNQDASTSVKNMVSTQQFLQIKKEVEAFDAYSEPFVPTAINLDETGDYDYDDEFLTRLYQHDKETTPTPSDFTSVNDDNIAIDYTVENNQADEEENHHSDNSLVIDVQEEPVQEESVQEELVQEESVQKELVQEEPIPARKIYIAPPIVEPHIQKRKRGRPKKNPVDKNQADDLSDMSSTIDVPIAPSVVGKKRGRPKKMKKHQADDLSDMSSTLDEPVVVKKTYIAPPIIEPHVQQISRRRLSRFTEKNPIATSSEEQPAKKRRMSTATKPATEDSSKASKDQLVSERKQKLKELALKAAADKERNENQYKPKNPVHVKVSNGRGNFLLPQKAQRDPRNNAGNRVQNGNGTYDNQHYLIQEYSEMIFDIIKWKVEWFQDADKMKPPQLTSRNLIGMCMSFACYNDYFDVLYPMLMYDCWNCACSDYRETKKSSNADIMAAITNVFVRPTHTEVLCTAWLESQVNLSNNHLKEKNLVSLTGRVTQEMRMMFGVVGWTHKEPIKKNDTLDSVVLRLYKTCPTTKLTFSLIIENNSEQFAVGSRICIRYFPNLPQYFKNYSTLKKLQFSPLIKYLLDPQPQDGHRPQSNKPVFSTERLNLSQVQAVSESVSLCVNEDPGIYLIEGPPGTGKSTVITSIIMEIILKCNSHKNLCVLLLAPSNAAIDSLITKLAYEIRPTLDPKQRALMKLVRVGNPDAVAHHILPLTLEKLADKNAVTFLLTQHPQVKKDYEALVALVKCLTTKFHAKPDDEALHKRLLEKQEELNKFFKTRFCVNYNDIVQNQQRKVLASANIICSTIGSCQKAFAGKMRDNIKFCIIDEASQASEIETLIPIGQGITKLVLVGDPKQLPAVTTNLLSKNLLYGQSLFARIKNKLDSTNFDPKLLNIQYRMNPEIAKYPNKAFYEGRIGNCPEFKAKLGLEKIIPYMLFSYEWSSDKRSNSQYYNYTELQCLVELLQVITNTVSAGTKLSIGIITPYAEQRQIINQQLSTLKWHSTVTITCNTVDSFQGQEKDVILLSCVRAHSNSFLADENRLCVALTRAKHALYIVGNISFLENCTTFSKLLEDAKQRNLYYNIRCVPKTVPWNHLIRKSSR